MRLGAHVSIAGGLARAPREALELGCETIQIFSGSKMQWRIRPHSDEEVRAFRRGVREAGIRNTLIHDSYLINLASPDPVLLERSRAAFAAEMVRADRLGAAGLVFHPGAHKGAGETAGIDRIVESLDHLLRTVRSRVALLLENTAGQGTSIGHRLEQLAAIIEHVSARQGAVARRRLGVCLDTCHLFAASYDLRSARSYEATMKEIERTVGLGRVRAMHLNDSKGTFGARLDRHAEIGEGRIGSRAFGRLVRDARFVAVPGILEIPGGMDAFRRSLRRLRRMRARGG